MGKKKKKGNKKNKTKQNMQKPDISRETEETKKEEWDGETAKWVLTEDVMNRFIGPNALQYTLKFNLLKKGIFGWNWCAFLVAPFWFMFRKMYGWFAVVMVISIAASGVIQHIAGDGSIFASDSGNTMINTVGWIMTGVLPGIFGDKLYLEHIKREHRLAVTMEGFYKKGGINRRGTFILLVLSFILVLSIIIYPHLQ